MDPEPEKPEITQEKLSEIQSTFSKENLFNQEGEPKFPMNMPVPAFMQSGTEPGSQKVPNHFMKMQGLLNKEGTCHLCKRKRTVYGCFKEYEPTQCTRDWCASCLDDIFHEKILDIVMKQKSWTCPVKRKLCPCKNCTGNYGEGMSSNIDAKIFENSGVVSGKLQQQLTKQINQNKIRNMMDFNANLLVKFEKNLDKLNDDEIRFYLSIMNDNLAKLNKVTNTIINKDLSTKQLQATVKKEKDT